MQKVELWRNIHGHMFDDECEFLANLASGKRVLEIGTHYGRSAAALASTAKSVVTIDTYLGDPQIGPPVLEETRANLAPFNNIILLVGDWKDQKIDTTQYDMMFYDGCHTEEGEFLVRLLNYRGVVALHDYKPGEKGMEHVVGAVNAYRDLTKRPLLFCSCSIVWFDALCK